MRKERKQLQRGKLVDVAVRKRTLDGDVHPRQLLSHFLRTPEFVQMRLDGCRGVSELEVGLSVDVGCLDVADPVGVAAVEDDAVRRNLLVLNKIQDVADADVLRRYFDDYITAEHLHHLAVRNLDDHDKPIQTSSDFRRFKSSLNSRMADTEKMNTRGSQVVQGLLTEIVLNN